MTSAIFAGLIKDIKNKLDESSQVPWRYGYINDWSKWARRMQSRIVTVLPILDRISEGFAEHDNFVKCLQNRIRELEIANIEKDKVIAILVKEQ